MNDRNDALLGVVALICCAVVVGLVLVFGNVGQVNVEIDYDAPKSITYTARPNHPTQPSYGHQNPTQRATAVPQRPTAKPIIQPKPKPVVKPAPSKPNKPKR